MSDSQKLVRTNWPDRERFDELDRLIEERDWLTKPDCPSAEPKLARPGRLPKKDLPPPPTEWELARIFELIEAGIAPRALATATGVHVEYVYRAALKVRQRRGAVRSRRRSVRT
jgi:hypothetical protein